MAEQIVLDVVKDFPGGRVRAGDVFLLDWADPRHTVLEGRWHGTDFLAHLHRQLNRLRCRDLSCHQCRWASSCPLSPGAPRRRWPRLLK